MQMMTPDGMYHGMYNQQTTYYDSMANINNFNSMIASINADIVRSNMVEICLNNLGWQRVTKEIYERIISHKCAKITFTSERNPADIYAVGYNTKMITNLNKKTPCSLLNPAEHWLPECYQAIFNGEASELICFDTQENNRHVHFSWHDRKKQPKKIRKNKQK